ncbi:hypothetical protein AAG906_019098 [Vitis piasezkii]
MLQVQKLGHIKYDCPLYKSEAKRRTKKAMMATWNESEESSEKKMRRKCGCSRHMTGDESKFAFLTKRKGGYVTFRDNAKGRIIGQGNIGLETSMGKLQIEDRRQQEEVVEDPKKKNHLWHYLLFNKCKFEMSMMGELNFFIGLQIKQLKEGTFINQAKYIRDLLKSQQSNASNGTQFGVETKKLQPLQANHSQLKEAFSKVLLNHPFAANTSWTRTSETPIGHESNGAVAEGVKFIVIPFLSTCDFYHKLVTIELSLNIMEATPKDQHSHQGRQDNLNEFRSMRNRMHPPCMTSNRYLVPLLPTFHGMESENPYTHIKEFEDVCNTFQEEETNGLKRQISNFSAKENEKFYECWERYMEAINACPHHGFDTWLLVSYFYDGIKNPEEAMDFLSYVADVSRGWDEPTKGEVGKMKSQLNAFNAKAGMYTLKEDDDMKAKMAAMTRRLEELELKRIHEVQVIL